MSDPDPVEDENHCSLCEDLFKDDEMLTWTCGCTWCAACIAEGITSAADYKLIWCSHTKVNLHALFKHAQKLLSEDQAEICRLYIANYQSGIQCANRDCRCRISRQHFEGNTAICPKCMQPTCMQCLQSCRSGYCLCSTADYVEEKVSSQQAQKATCPKCGDRQDYTNDDNYHTVCPQPCGQHFCIRCSKYWVLCKGQCKHSDTNSVPQMETAPIVSGIIVKNALDLLRSQVEKEMASQADLSLPTSEWEDLEMASIEIIAEVEMALQAQPKTPDYHRLRERVDQFLAPLRERSGPQITQEQRNKAELAKLKRAIPDDELYISLNRKRVKVDDTDEETDILAADLEKELSNASQQTSAGEWIGFEQHGAVDVGNRANFFEPRDNTAGYEDVVNDSNFGPQVERRHEPGFNLDGHVENLDDPDSTLEEGFDNQPTPTTQTASTPDEELRARYVELFGEDISDED